MSDKVNEYIKQVYEELDECEEDTKWFGDEEVASPEELLEVIFSEIDSNMEWSNCKFRIRDFIECFK